MPVNNSGLSRKHLVEGLNQSLGRLGLDYGRLHQPVVSPIINADVSVDLVYAHRPDRDTPMEETVRAFNHLIDSGKAFYWGTSMWRAEEIAAAWRVAEKLNMIGPLMEQPEYNMLVRDKVEKEYELLYEHYGTGLTVFSPIKGGILSGKYNDGIPDDSRIANAKDSYTKELAKTVGDEAWEKQTETVRKLKVFEAARAISDDTDDL
jgi:aryl-alcohol dehydrogenase-like predicted oxidoreductase